MKVLHVFKTYWPETFGGIERAIHSIAEGTAKYGVESTVFTLADNPAPLPANFGGHRIVRAKRIADVASTGLSLDAFGKFREAVREADLIHYQFPWPFMDLLHLTARSGKPAFVSYQSDIVKQKGLLSLYSPLMRRFLSDMDAIVVASPNYLQTSSTLAGFRAKTRVIPLGLEEGDYPSPDATLLERWRARFPRPFFLFTGVFRYYKGLHILLEAASGVDADIVLVGSGPEEGRLREIASRHGLTNVHFAGPLEDRDKNALLSLCIGFVFPSHLRSEAYGLSLVEAAMAGKPMISCEIGSGTSFVNSDGVTGFVVPPADPQALAQGMQNLAVDNALAETMGAAARKRYEDLFTGERMAAAYFDLYSELLRR